MYRLPRVEFYITNVCNLNCDNCNRFNNFAFEGHYRWSDHEPSYQQWAKIIDFRSISILGGEPFANPDLKNWILGIRRLWPDSDLQIITNGTYLSLDKEIYDIIASDSKNIEIEISGHNWQTFDDIFNSIRAWLSPGHTEVLHTDDVIWKQRYEASRYSGWPDCATVDDYDLLSDEIKDILYNVARCVPDLIFPRKFTDRNGVRVSFTPVNYFYYTPIIHHVENGTLSIRNSDPQKAIDICYSKTCHTFKGDKLYKCGPAALLPDFIRQFPVQMTEEDREIINAVQGAEWSWSDDRMKNFIKNLLDQDPIDQCKFCIEDQKTVFLSPLPGKKIKIQKIKRDG